MSQAAIIAASGTSSQGMHEQRRRPSNGSNSISVTGRRASTTTHFGSTTSRRVFGSFISAADDENDKESLSAAHTIAKNILNSTASESFIAGVIMFNFLLICAETNAKASHVPAPDWVLRSGDVCFGIFVVEFIMRIYVERLQVVKNPWNWLDAVIILSGTIDYIFIYAGNTSFVDLSFIRILRISRLLRVLRFIWKLQFFRELRKIFQMLHTCIITLMWSFLLLAVSMTVWAVVAVETVNPIVERLAEHNTWEGCIRCSKSFSSVFHANITFFQTIIAGDSWGRMAIPVIEDSPWTSIIFVGSLLTLIYGVITTVIAVVVDTFAEIRSKDITGRGCEMEFAEIEEKKTLKKIFKKIDSDNSGAISLDELKEGAEKVVEFRHWLRVLDIDAVDLQRLFQIIDEDSSGEIDPTEFIDVMYRIKNTESKTATRFVKHMVTELDNKQIGIEDKLLDVHTKVDRVRATVDSRLQDIADKNEEFINLNFLKQVKELESTIEGAISRVSEVALEAAYEAASLAAARVTMEPCNLSIELTEEADGTNLRSSNRYLSCSPNAEHVKASGKPGFSDELSTELNDEHLLSDESENNRINAACVGPCGPRGRPSQNLRPFLPLGCQAVPKAPEVQYL